MYKKFRILKKGAANINEIQFDRIELEYANGEKISFPQEELESNSNFFNPRKNLLRINYYMNPIEKIYPEIKRSDDYYCNLTIEVYENDQWVDLGLLEDSKCICNK